MGLIDLLIYFVIFCVVVGLLWFVSQRLPAPLQGWAQMAIVVIAAIFIIYLLLSMVGSGGLRLAPIRVR